MIYFIKKLRIQKKSKHDTQNFASDSKTNDLNHKKNFQNNDKNRFECKIAFESRKYNFRALFN